MACKDTTWLSKSEVPASWLEGSESDTIWLAESEQPTDWIDNCYEPGIPLEVIAGWTELENCA